MPPILSRRNAEVVAYACDGSARRPATLSAWFEAAWDGRAPITIVSDGGAKLRVERVHADERISGTTVSTRKPCRFVLITGANGQQQWVSVCN